MAKATEEISTKFTFEAKGRLKAIAQSRDCDMQDLIREAVDHFIAEEIRKAHAGKVLLRLLKDEQVEGG